MSRLIYPSSVLVQPRKTRPCLTERFLMGRKVSANSCQQDVTIDVDPGLPGHGRFGSNMILNEATSYPLLKLYVKLTWANLTA